MTEFRPQDEDGIQARVLAAFRSEPLTTEEVRQRFGLTVANTSQVLKRLVARGALERIGRGEYRRKKVT